MVVAAERIAASAEDQYQDDHTAVEAVKGHVPYPKKRPGKLDQIIHPGKHAPWAD